MWKGGSSLRIVAGTRKSIPLKAIPGDGTRPTTDKVKESLFNIIGPYFDGERVLDLFAGSGGLGLEALSRGAKEAVFVEKNGKAIQVLKENVEKAKFIEEAVILKEDAKKAVERLAEENRVFDLVFLDPPYAQTKLYSLAERLLELQLIATDAFIICEHEKHLAISDLLPSFTHVRTEIYGSLAISLFECKETKGDTTS
ncbi:16S rRNA (guanine(966)-N(2))-methyltransferase RsmD [Chryseomicrobium palamuruense]|uniref:16S rRNA (Guanine(966)-N(2))-methyltransferase RsmD n=1 Tax=Chryseomicrobium palamuruense TaxID=682973 RepID=A0ABV8USW9_9BACL